METIRFNGRPIVGLSDSTSVQPPHRYASSILLPGVGAALGGWAGSMTAPHYEDIPTGGANRTAVYGDEMAMRAIIGAVAGALVGGFVSEVSR